MKKNRKADLIISILILYSVFSVLFYINSNRLEITENENNQHCIIDYIVEDILVFDSLDDGISIHSKENLQKSKISIFIEYFLKKSKEIIYLISINCLYSSGFLLLIKFVATSKEHKKATQLEIDGVHVTEDEVKVFNLIEEFLNENRIFNKDKVLFHIKSRANNNLNTDGINRVIDSLLKKNLIMEGSKLTRRIILLNSNREQIFKIIKQYPGIYKNKIAKVLNLCPYVINWHLSKLQAFNLIRERNITGQICYFDYLSSNENDYLYMTINKEKCRRIIEFLVENKNGCTKNQISRELNMHYNTVNRYINEIDDFNLLNRTKLNHREYLTLNEQKFQQITTRFS